MSRPRNTTKMGSLADLPSSDSPSLGLVQATDKEKEKTFRLNGASWRGALCISDYLEREAHLGEQFLTRDGGITYWILVDTTLKADKRPILASCETLRKRAWIAKSGKIEEVVAHGIGSVFCNPKYRGRGYAKALLLHTFREFYERGMPRVTLGVDAESPTGATHLYERVGMHVEHENVVFEKVLS